MLREATSLEERDQFCPKTELSWCKYQSDIVNGTATYKHKPGIHTALRKLLKHVFKNLNINELLSTCLHGKAQNNNKYLNSIISKRCPKYIFVGRTTLSMGVSSAVINFNNGDTWVITSYAGIWIKGGRVLYQFLYFPRIQPNCGNGSQVKQCAKKSRKHAKRF